MIGGHEGRIVRHGGGRHGRTDGVEGGAGEALGVAGGVEGEAAAARVPGRIAATASHEPEAVGHGDRHGDTVVVEFVDLAVPVDSGHGEHNDENGQGHQTESDRYLSDSAGVVVHSGPPQGREGPRGGARRTGGVGASGAVIGLSIP